MTPLQSLGAQRWRPAWIYAGEVHRTQSVPGETANYLSHLGAVTLEVISAHLVEPLADLDLAVQCAILHDTIEDQGVTAGDIEKRFGSAVASGVLALSKSAEVPKSEAMADSLRRIRQQPAAVWCVKLADRITNLHGIPPHWAPDKAASYRTEAVAILDALRTAHGALAQRLQHRIDLYPHRANEP